MCVNNDKGCVLTATWDVQHRDIRERDAHNTHRCPAKANHINKMGLSELHLQIPLMNRRVILSKQMT